MIIKLLWLHIQCGMSNRMIGISMIRMPTKWWTYPRLSSN